MLSYAWGPVCDQLEARVLLSTFHVYVAGPRRTPSGSATTLKLYSTGESVSSYTVTWPDGHVDHPTVSTPITTDSYTITGGLTGEQTISVTATSTLSHNATAVYAVDSDFGNFPGSGGGENVFTPTSSTSTSAVDVVVDPNHSDNVYTIESYTPSGSTAEFGITRLSNTGVIDTAFGQTGHAGTFVVPSFGGGSDVPVRAYLSGTTMVIVGHCADGWAAASIDVTGAGTRNWDSGTALETSGQANAVYNNGTDSFIVGTNGTYMTAIEVDTNGAKVSTFGSSGVKIYSTAFSSSTGSDALAITQNPDNTADIVLAGWESFTYNGGACTGCSFAVLFAAESDGGLDTNYGGGSGVCTVNVGCTAFVHAIHGCNGTGNPSQDVAYSLVPDAGNADLMAIGTTSFGYLAVAAFTEVDGTLDTINFSSTGLGVSDTTASQFAGGGAVDNTNPSNYLGDVYSVGASTSGDYLVDRFSPTSSSTYAALDTIFGSGGEDTLDFGTTSANTTDTAWGVGLESDETAVVAGQTTSSTGKVAVARFIQRNTLLIASSGNSPPKTASVFSSGPNISVPGSAASDAISIDPTGQHKLHAKRGARLLFTG
jgi:hypothetical protein